MSGRNPRDLRRRGRPLVPAHAGMSVSEAWKGGDAEDCSVELAKQENGRAEEAYVQKTETIKLLG